MHTGFWWGNLKEGDGWENPDVDGTIIFQWIFQKWDSVWSRSSLLRTETGKGLL